MLSFGKKLQKVELPRERTVLTCPVPYLLPYIQTKDEGDEFFIHTKPTVPVRTNLPIPVIITTNHQSSSSLFIIQYHIHYSLFTSS